VFIDVDPDYWQLDAGKLQEFIEHECRWADGALRNRATGRRIRAVLPVDLLGHPADMRAVVDIARGRDLAVVEDATESLGALYRGQPVGRLSDVACFSFNGNKIVTSGGGGMITTDDSAWAARARFLTTQARTDSAESIHGEVGFNYRLTNIQAAVGVAQVERLDGFVDAKRAIAGRYRTAVEGIDGLRMMGEAPWARAAFWLSTVLVDADRYGRTSRDLLMALKCRSIEARPLWQPLHLSPAHRASAAAPCPVAEELYRNAVSLPSSVALSEHDQQRVVDVLMSAESAR
jgi:perosamine synthetase